MKVFYSLYTLTPLKRANRLSSLDKKQGVLLKGVLGNKVTFADYFPHIPLGDRSVEQFLSEFKFQNEEYDKKVFDLLLRDYDFQNLKAKKFYNHQLWTGKEPLEAKTVKYKMLCLEDRNFLSCFEKGTRVRLDANALFNKSQFETFLKDIPSKYHSLFDYVEDPLSNKDWKGLIVPTARDFIEGDPFDFYIYKPNCEFRPTTEAKIIYSAYLGNNLGNWHAYCELATTADLSLIHGIIGQGFYEEEVNFLEGSYFNGFTPNNTIVRSIYQDASNLNWKSLCSI